MKGRSMTARNLAALARTVGAVTVAVLVGVIGGIVAVWGKVRG